MGEVIVKEGDKEDTIYFLRSGKIGVYKGRKLIAVVDKPGAPIGEISAILGVERSATCIALGRTEVAEYKGGVDNIVTNHPKVAKMIMEILAERILASDQVIAGIPVAKEIKEEAEEEKEKEEVKAPTFHPRGFEFLASCDTRTLQRALMDLDEMMVAKALWNAPKDAVDRIMSNISRRRREIIEECVEKLKKEPPSEMEIRVARRKIEDKLASTG